MGGLAGEGAKKSFCDFVSTELPTLICQLRRKNIVSPRVLSGSPALMTTGTEEVGKGASQWLPVG